MKYYQQGDVILIPVKKSELNRHAKKTRTSILQLGEATGHAHRVHGPSYMVWETTWNKHLVLGKPAVLRHEEHKPIKLPRGAYEIRIVREFDHFIELPRKVRD